MMITATQCLWNEMHAAARNYLPERLLKFGIEPEHAIATGGLGVAKISPVDDGLFELGGEVSAVVLPVYWADIPTEEAPVDDGDLIDLLAFNPNEPDRWWLRRGDGILLGAGALDHLYLGAELQVCQTPLKWLLDYCEGCVALDWPRAADRLRSIETLAIKDISFAEEVRRYLQKPLLVPDIRVPLSTLEKAA